MILGLIELSVAEAVLLAGVLGVVLREAADRLGWTRSSRLLRKENEDLVRVNDQLEARLKTHEDTILRQGETIKVLEGRVEELSKRDQEAVLRQLQDHEQAAERRHRERREEDAQHHSEFLEIMGGVRELLGRLVEKEAAA